MMHLDVEKIRANPPFFPEKKKNLIYTEILTSEVDLRSQNFLSKYLCIKNQLLQSASIQDFTVFTQLRILLHFKIFKEFCVFKLLLLFVLCYNIVSYSCQRSNFRFLKKVHEKSTKIQLEKVCNWYTKTKWGKNYQMIPI